MRAHDYVILAQVMILPDFTYELSYIQIMYRFESFEPSCSVYDQKLMFYTMILSWPLLYYFPSMFLLSLHTQYIQSTDCILYAISSYDIGSGDPSQSRR